MMDPTFKSPRALEMAVKEAAKLSPMDTGKAVSSFYFHRLLCRVFADDSMGFVLKGGQGMLARTLDARTTRDIDLLSKRGSLDDALDDLLEVSRKDLGDFVSFELTETRPIKADDEYRSGLSVRFAPYLGAKKMQDISIDLVVDQIQLDHAQRITPIDRLDVGGVEVCDYLVYPVENALADKLCALIERHDGRPSSRVKDLVDIVIYATTCEVDGDSLQRAIHRERSARRLAPIGAFSVPEEWGDAHDRQFASLCAQTGLVDSLRLRKNAEALASTLLEPAIRMSVTGKRWNHDELCWRE